VLVAFPEEAPLAIAAWSKAGALNAEGNPSEQWLAGEELQTLLKKIKETIAQAAATSPDPNASMWLDGPLWEILENGGMVALEGIDIDKKTQEVSFISYQYDRGSIVELLKSFGKGPAYKKVKIGDDTVHSTTLGNISIHIGFHGEYLVITLSKDLWEKVAKRIDAGQRAPAWAREIFAEQPIARLSNFGYINIEKIKERLASSSQPSMGQAIEIIDRLKVDSVAFRTGTDDISNIAVTQIFGDETGLLSAIDTVPLSLAQLKEIPVDCTAAIGVKLSTDNILQLVQNFVPDEPIETSQPMLQFKEFFGVDLKSEVLDLLEGDARGFSSGSILKPLMVGVVGIKEPEKFQSALEKINGKIKEEAERSGGEFVQKKGRDGVTVYGFKPTFGSGVYWAVHESELLFGSNNRAIGSFLRKRGNRESSLVDQPLVAAILKAPPAGSTGPSGVQITDMNQMIEAMLPAVAMALNFLPPDAGIDFSPDDIPSPEALAGLRPNAMIGFKTPTGATMISRYDIPIPIEASSGVMIGMLLPAVQQVRAAARRTETLNNFRQLALAVHNFEAANRRLPAAFSVDEDGNRLLSWRVHLLPYLEEQELYDQFHLDEPWDSPHNIKLLKKIPAVYESKAQELPEGHTMAVVPVTQASVISQNPEDGNLGIEFADVTDGLSNTMLFVEAGVEYAVPWTAPRDLDVEKLSDAAFDTGHPGTFCAALGDGSTHSVSQQMDVESLVGGCVINDGEVIQP